MNKILVTGSTGNVAQAVIANLKGKASVRALVHTEKKAQGLKDAGVEVALGDFANPDSLAKALEGIDSVFLCTPPGPNASAYAKTFLDVAKKTNPRIVRLSALKASLEGPTDNTRQHGRTDLDVVASGLRFVILRPNFFMQNLFMAAPGLKKDGAMYWGMGDGKLGMIDVRDVGDVGAAALLDSGWDGGVYELTGATSLGFHDVARSLTQAAGRPMKYVPVPPEAVEKSLKDMGMGDWFPAVMRDYSKAYAAGWGDYATGLVQKIAGHPARDFDTFVRELYVHAIR